MRMTKIVQKVYLLLETACLVVHAGNSPAAASCWEQPCSSFILSMEHLATG